MVDSGDGGPVIRTVVTCSWLPGQHHKPFICVFCC